MIDPRKNNFELSKHDFDSQRQFANFQRIQVNPRRVVEDTDFRSLSTPARQELMEKLIDHVRDL
jgi:hypothetical protein